jgi:hypothetical protein
MKRGHPKHELRIKRDEIETAQAELVGLVRDLDEVMLRLQQAMRRTQLVADVLAPAMKRTAEIRKALRRVHEQVNTAWARGQENNWK